MKIVLKCYIALCSSSKMEENLRLQDVKEFLGAIDC